MIHGVIYVYIYGFLLMLHWKVLIVKCSSLVVLFFSQFETFQAMFESVITHRNNMNKYNNLRLVCNEN